MSIPSTRTISSCVWHHAKHAHDQSEWLGCEGDLSEHAPQLAGLSRSPHQLVANSFIRFTRSLTDPKQLHICS
eukprot:1393338-Pleurochrysis_carterae.AAC.3